jgi:S-phase kinase-associated protein 1
MVDIVAKKVKLKTSDNIIKEVDSDILMKSKLLRGLFEDLEPEELEEIIALNGVDSKYLDLIIKYLEHYKDMEPKEIPKPFPERTDEEFMKGILNDQWTYDYLTNQTLDELINLVNAADYLQIDGLINIIAAKLAHEKSNCTVEEARKKFGIKCDMTEEEIAEIDKYPLD